MLAMPQGTNLLKYLVKKKDMKTPSNACKLARKSFGISLPHLTSPGFLLRQEVGYHGSPFVSVLCNFTASVDLHARCFLDVSNPAFSSSTSASFAFYFSFQDLSLKSVMSSDMSIVRKLSFLDSVHKCCWFKVKLIQDFSVCLSVFPWCSRDLSVNPHFCCFNALF